MTFSEQSKVQFFSAYLLLFFANYYVKWKAETFSGTEHSEKYSHDTAECTVSVRLSCVAEHACSQVGWISLPATVLKVGLYCGRSTLVKCLAYIVRTQVSNPGLEPTLC